MCIAILNKVGTLPKEYIQNSWDNNYHGAGLAFSDGTRIVTYKTDTNADNFYKKYKKYRKQHPDVPFLIHFRISTHGTISIDNLHPFVINDNVALIHNGMVDLSDHKNTDNRSDTRFLCEEMLAKMPDGWQHSEGIHRLIEEVGGYSKFVLLDIDHNYSIIGEDSGHWFEDNWYSNNSYKQVNRYVDYGGKKVDKYASTGNSFSTSRSAGFGYGTYNDWDDYYTEKPITTVKDYSKTTCVDTHILRKIEKHIVDSGAVDKHFNCYSSYTDTEVLHNIGLVDSLHGEESGVQLNTWYNIGGKNELLVTEIDGLFYTIVGERKEHYGYLYVYPCAIRHDDLISSLLDMFDNDKAYSTAGDKLANVAADCYWLIDYAQEEILRDDVSDAYAKCDACLNMCHAKDVNPLDGMEHWNVCNDCVPAYSAVVS